ncbi:MAG TPA: ACT domain-containing protein [Planctomycetota bacterium]|nr:ACT domain-containing protein [Planctomycetota bacterium]
MPIGSEVRVTLQDKPGSLAQVASTLGNAKLNITGFTVTGGNGRFFVDDATKATMALAKAGIPAWTAPVLCLDIENKPGTLARVAGALAERGVNVECGYAAATPTGRATVVLDISDPKIATEIEKHLG